MEKIGWNSSPRAFKNIQRSTCILKRKTNYGLISTLPSFTKVFEKVMYMQLCDYIRRFLNQLLCGFRKEHATQYSLFRLLTSLHKKWSFPLKISSVNVNRCTQTADLVIFTEDVINRKLHFLCSASWQKELSRRWLIFKEFILQKRLPSKSKFCAMYFCKRNIQKKFSGVISNQEFQGVLELFLI